MVSIRFFWVFRALRFGCEINHEIEFYFNPYLDPSDFSVPARLAFWLRMSQVVMSSAQPAAAENAGCRVAAKPTGRAADVGSACAANMSFEPG
jgi:hypothetical protein